MPCCKFLAQTVRWQNKIAKLQLWKVYRVSNKFSLFSTILFFYKSHLILSIFFSFPFKVYFCNFFPSEGIISVRQLINDNGLRGDGARSDFFFIRLKLMTHSTAHFRLFRICTIESWRISRNHLKGKPYFFFFLRSFQPSSDYAP